MTWHVLVVDDEAEARSSIRQLLERRGFRVTVAGEGQEALQLLGSGLRPDIVLTDWRMPGMNGLDLTRAVKRDYKHIPVVVLTAYHREDIEEGIASGADQFVAKPSELDDLVLRLRTTIERYRGLPDGEP